TASSARTCGSCGARSGSRRRSSSGPGHKTRPRRAPARSGTSPCTTRPDGHTAITARSRAWAPISWPRWASCRGRTTCRRPSSTGPADTYQRGAHLCRRRGGPPPRHADDAHVAAHAGGAGRGAVDPPAHHPSARRQPLLDRQHPTAQARVPTDPLHFLPLRGAVLRPAARSPRGPTHRLSARARRLRHRAARAGGRRRDERAPLRLPLLLQAHARDGALLRLRRVADRARCVPVPEPAADLGRVLLEGELPVPDVRVPMSGAATLEEPVADETGVRERRYVLAMIRARWGLLAFGVALLTVVRLVGL